MGKGKATAIWSSPSYKSWATSRSVPVATTVHPIQIVDGFPTDSHDVPLILIITPDTTLSVEEPSPPPTSIDWSALNDEDLEAMPVLQTLRHRATR